MILSRHLTFAMLALCASAASAVGPALRLPAVASGEGRVSVPRHADERQPYNGRPSASIAIASPEIEARTGMALIPAGSYAPLIRTKDEPETLPVAAFWFDVRPVTNAEFLEFVRTHPQWRRSAASPLFADTGYLGDWAGDLELGPRAPANAPVVRVSWFAARAFARAQGKRLPTTAEWERAASAGFTSANGATEPGFAANALAWFTRPTLPTLPDAGAGRANFFGVRDLFGLIWEWVDDFNTAMVTGESRADSGLERDLFCGSGAAGARDPSDYAAFMRAGFRSSLRASYAVPNLGFRCATDAVAETVPGNAGVPPAFRNVGKTPALPGNEHRL